MKSGAGLRFGVLGALDVASAERPVSISAPKQRIALATLLLHANTYVSLGQLAATMWDGKSPVNARSSVQTHITRLRRSLGAEGSHLIETRDQGYLMRADQESLDVLRFFDLLDRAAQAARDGAAAREADLLRQALSLWRGPVLANVPSETIHRDHVPSLTEKHIGALERWFDLCLLLGLHSEIITELTAATNAHPLRERLWAQLMLTLYRSGRQAEALESYRTIAGLLREELGLDPAEELRWLHERMLSGDPDLQTPSGQLTPPLPGDRATAEILAHGPSGEVTSEDAQRSAEWQALNQLPPGVADFVGRAEAMAAGLDLLAQQSVSGPRILAVCGPPGVGKSALALQLAHRLTDRFPDGRLYVRLDGASPSRPRKPAEVLAELLQMTGVKPAAIPEALDQRTSAMRARLAGRRILLLLDDVANIAQILPLLPGEAGCAVLLTSRQQLAGLPGADVMQVGALTRDETRELLGRLAGHARIAREPQAADSIGAACGQLPLALRIAGARLAVRPNWALARLAARLRDETRRLDELASGDLSVRPSLDISYAALPEEVATAFRHAGLFNGGDFAAWSLGVVAGVPDAEPLIDQLLRANLLEAAGTDITGEPRYRLHDLLTVYARELLAGDDPAFVRAAERRLLEALLALARVCYHTGDATAALDGLRPVPYEARHTLSESQLRELSRVPQEWLLAEHRQLLDAIERACARGWHTEAAALLGLIIDYLDVYVGRGKVIRLLALIRDAALAAGDEGVGWRAEYHRNHQIFSQGLLAEATAGVRQCVEVFDRLEMPYELAHGLGMLGFCLYHAGELEEAVATCRRAVDAAERLQDDLLMAAALRDLGTGLGTLGRYAEAIDHLNRAMALVKRHGRGTSIANILGRLVGVALQHGDQSTARSAVDEAIKALGSDDPYGTAWLLYWEARITVAEGSPDEALRLATRAGSCFMELSDQRGENLAKIAEGEALIALGRPNEAASLLEAAASALENLGADLMAGHARQLRAQAEADGGSIPRPPARSG
ncbi:AfsR/SARP family transcriptional regulator [Nonomuraea basaltis]|uniref:AfsR/SARP family transcriptional regulator n=1 Tax=Nonomuraea basaltis TaxID=2495887 RepID=UPI00110C4538|nr:BTAD domain-containing putative transcriptional regulator [Nonomuraea basaltis]TMR89732.1 tetratricopeptide repeat protein [Nonomuraea basaltis]